MLFDPGEKQIVVIFSLTATDNFTITFRCQHINGKCHPGVLGVTLHIKRLDFRRISMHQNRPIKLLGDNCLISATEVAAPFEVHSLLLQDLHRFIVTDTRQRLLYVLQELGVAFQHFEFLLPVLQHRLYNVLEKFLSQFHVVVQVVERHFRLHHPELRQVTSCFRFLCPERRTEHVHLAESHCSGFTV